MKIRHGNLTSSVARLLLTSLILFACLTLFTESAQAQRPAPTPMPLTDKSDVGEPERVELGEGKYKLVYRNKAGQVVKEIEFVLGAEVSTRYTEEVYPNGRPAKVDEQSPIPIHHGDGSAFRFAITQYDEFGNPQQRLPYTFTKSGHKRFQREKWNQRTQRWEPAPERKRWNPNTGKWEEVPENERWEPQLGKWAPPGQRWNNGRWEDVPKNLRWDPKTESWVEVPTSSPSDASDNRTSQPDNARATLDEMDGIKRNTSASPGYGAESTVANGLSVATFTTPQGTIYVNLPSDMAAGNTLTGTVVAETKAEDPKQRTKLERELSQYSVKIGQQQVPISAGRALLQFVAPSAATFLTLIDKKGKDVCRSEVPVAASLPAGGDFTLPTLGQQGHPVEIRGSFDGDFDTTRVRIGGQDIQLVAESPRRLIARNTSPRAGLAEIELREGNQTQRGQFRSLGISLSAPKLNLLRGEGTTLTIVVTGLEDLRESIPLVIENKSPGVISMGGGNLQQVMIAPGDVRQGSYTTERPLTGIERGGFTITATVTRNDQGDQSQRGLVSP